MEKQNTSSEFSIINHVNPNNPFLLFSALEFDKDLKKIKQYIKFDQVKISNHATFFEMDVSIEQEKVLQYIFIKLNQIIGYRVFIIKRVEESKKIRFEVIDNDNNFLSCFENIIKMLSE